MTGLTMLPQLRQSNSSRLARVDCGTRRTDDLMHSRQLASRAIGVKARVQTLRHHGQFQFKRHPMQHQ